MDKAEMRFQVTKNKLDNDYQKHLNYMNIGLASVVTVAIGMIIYYLQSSNVKAASIFLFLGMASGMAVVLYFSDQLRQISEDIEKLAS